MRRLLQLAAILCILYIFMVGWNTLMYKQVPAVVIHSFWLFAAIVIVGSWMLKTIKRHT